MLVWDYLVQKNLVETEFEKLVKEGFNKRIDMSDFSGPVLVKNILKNPGNEEIKAQIAYIFDSNSTGSDEPYPLSDGQWEAELTYIVYYQDVTVDGIEVFCSKSSESDYRFTVLGTDTLIEGSLVGGLADNESNGGGDSVGEGVFDGEGF